MVDAFGQRCSKIHDVPSTSGLILFADKIIGLCVRWQVKFGDCLCQRDYLGKLSGDDALPLGLSIVNILTTTLYVNRCFALLCFMTSQLFWFICVEKSWKRLTKNMSKCLKDARKPIAVPVRKLSVYLQPFRRSSFLEFALQPKIAKINKTPYFWSSGSFKIIDVNTTKKLVTSACCDR